MPTLTAAAGLILGGRAAAQTFKTLHSFDNSDGSHVQAGLTISGNTLYGAADSGGIAGNGTVFKVNTDGTGFTNLYGFTATSGSYSSNSDGANPDGTLVLSGATLYGTAYFGGTAGNGTVFKVNTNGTGFTNLHSFAAGSGSFPYNYTNSDGACPEAGLIISSNILYGTTEKGGSSGLGAVFAVNTDGTGFTNLHSFTGGANGDVPEGLLLSGNTLFGMASGFSSGNGAVFKVNTDGTGFTNLHSFTGKASPGGMVLAGNTLYGAAYQGGSAGYGAVFAINTDGTGFANLYSFTATSGPNRTNSDGASPAGRVLLSGSTLYGTAYWGGSEGNGTVFAVSTNGTGFAILHCFTSTNTPNATNSDGASPYAGLLLSGNNLYGTAKWGGGSGYGTMFSLSLSTQLTIFRLRTNVLLTWPTNAAGLALQSTTNLVSQAGWTTVSPGPVVVNGQNAVTNPAASGRKFYRLSN